jgi:23S rRNA pseudouridine955/2504/2580 synthase|tara:strand:- start:15715 stop:16683 length:969 start_codon:yes stop_codon:yes gene_type:complete
LSLGAENFLSIGEQVQFVEVTSRHEGQRVDNFLMRELKGVPRSRVYRLIRKGEVRINKKRCKPETKLILGDMVRIPPYSGASTKEPGKITPALKDYLLENILFEDDEVLVINKPSGLSVHGGSGIKLGLIEALRQIKPEWAQIELAHRIDRETSGCLIVAKTVFALRALHLDFKERRVGKTYQALVYGRWPEEITRIQAKLLRKQLDSGERLVKVDEEGKDADTVFRVLKKLHGATLIEAKPATGRTHQIRVHCQHAGYPIVGDDRYAQRKVKDQFPQLSKAKALCLHAARIEFQLPKSGETVVLTADIGLNLQVALALITE